LRPDAPVTKPARQLAHAGQQRHGAPVDLHLAAGAARHLQRVAGQAEAGDVGQRMHAGSAARSGPGVLSCVVVAIICA
jgi:hypothetical protein